MSDALITHTCLRCGKEFSVYQSRAAEGRGIFCSQVCRRTFVRESRPRTAVCERCGKTFAVQPHRIERGTARYCGHVCSKLGPVVSLADFHAAHVDRSGECWLWTGAMNTNGYGRFVHEHKSYYAHRVAYELTRGPIPEGMAILHSCDNPRCVRPEHLSVGTHRENMAERDERNRTRHGEMHPHAKLTPAKVRAIRVTFAAGGVSVAALARLYGVDSQSISDAISHKTWKRVV